MTPISCSILNTNTKNNSKQFSAITTQVEKLDKLILEEDVTNTEVSKWSTYKQIEHILLANTGICEFIENGKKPSEEKSRTFFSYLPFTFGFIPRGRAEAPSYVVPAGITQDEIKLLLVKYKDQLSRIKVLSNLNSNDVVGNHPYFGGLNRLEWIRFMEIHTNHHLKIIEDIKKF